jgi:hypothetical protein
MKKQDLIKSHSEFTLYQTEDGQTRIQCRFENETLWLTQAQIAELFQTTPQNVTLHFKAIFSEGELMEVATCKDYLQVRFEGGDNPVVAFIEQLVEGSTVYQKELGHE